MKFNYLCLLLLTISFSCTPNNEDPLGQPICQDCPTDLGYECIDEECQCPDSHIEVQDACLYDGNYQVDQDVDCAYYGSPIKFRFHRNNIIELRYTNLLGIEHRFFVNDDKVGADNIYTFTTDDIIFFGDNVSDYQFYVVSDLTFKTYNFSVIFADSHGKVWDTCSFDAYY